MNKATNYEIFDDCHAVYQPEYKSFEVFLGQHKIPFFTLPLIEIMLTGLEAIANETTELSNKIDYFVLRSAYDGIFNLGADLTMINKLVSEKNPSAIDNYAQKCINLMYMLYTGINKKLVTIALVEGKCFGGGLEAALACDYLIAEESALFSFPEVKLGIFPGMGAASIMSTILSKRDYLNLFQSGRIFTAKELYEMGVVTKLVPPKTGESALREFITEINTVAHYQLLNIYKENKIVEFSQLKLFAKRWVECLMQLNRKQLLLISYAASTQQ